MAFVKVGELLQKVAERTVEDQAMEAVLVLERVNSRIGELFGEKAIGNVKAVRYKDGVLTFGVSNSVWAHEVKMGERKVKKLYVFKKIILTIF